MARGGAYAALGRFLRVGRKRIVYGEDGLLAVIVAGVSHATAPIEVREKLAFRPQDAAKELARLRRKGFIREGVTLSTCNRTELYAVEENGDAVARITDTFSERLGEDAARFVYVRHDKD